MSDERKCGTCKFARQMPAGHERLWPDDRMCSTPHPMWMVRSMRTLLQVVDVADNATKCEVYQPKEEK